MLAEIESKIRVAKEVLELIGYSLRGLSAQEFFDFMTGETFSGDTTTLNDVLKNEYLLIHEVVEINELKSVGRKIDKRIIVDSPKSIIYAAHFTALEKELEYALHKKDYNWVKNRIKQHKLVLESDPHLPDEMKPKAKTILSRYEDLLAEETNIIQ
jgi:hypothetical protein